MLIRVCCVGACALNAWWVNFEVNFPIFLLVLSLKKFPPCCAIIFFMFRLTLFAILLQQPGVDETGFHQNRPTVAVQLRGLLRQLPTLLPARCLSLLPLARCQPATYYPPMATTHCLRVSLLHRHRCIIIVATLSSSSSSSSLSLSSSSSSSSSLQHCRRR